jgi:hypothetical protein
MSLQGSLRTAFLVALAGLLPACATTGPDPLESWNRQVFKFNEGFDKYLLEPAATGWDWVLPEVAQTGVRNFFDNLGMPVTLVNDILQLKPLPALQDLSRIMINTTAGIGGFIDVATMVEIPENDEDFGQTLGRYGVPPGAYLVIPLLGSSTVRGRSGDPPLLLCPALGIGIGARGGHGQQARLHPGGRAGGARKRHRFLRVRAKHLPREPAVQGGRWGFPAIGVTG